MRIKYLFLLASAFSLTLLSCGNEDNSSTNNQSNVPSTGQETTPNLTPNIVDNQTSDTYTIKWLNYDGTELEVDTDVSTPLIPSYDGEEPFKPSDYDGFFTFSGWVLGDSKNNERSYVAQFTKNNYIFKSRNTTEFGITKDSLYYYQKAYHILVPATYDSKNINYVEFENDIPLYNLRKVGFSDSITNLYLEIRNCFELEEIILPNDLTTLTLTLELKESPKLKYNVYDNGIYIGSKINPYLVLLGAISNEAESIKINKNCKIISRLSSYNISTINYEGTTSEWNLIGMPKYSYYWNTSATEVTCSDGTVTL